MDPVTHGNEMPTTEDLARVGERELTIEDTLRRFEVEDPAMPSELYDVLTAARQRCPVAFSEAENSWIVTRYDDVKTVMSDAKTYSSALQDAISESLIRIDPPVHREYRRLLDPLFTRRALAQHDPAMRAIALELVQSIAPRGRCEIISEYAGPLPAAILISIIFGLDFWTRRDEILDVAHAIELGTSAPPGEIRDQAFSRSIDLAKQIIEERRRSGVVGDDLVDVLMHGTIDGEPLTEDVIVANITLVLMAGLDTTKAAIGSIIHRAAESPAVEAFLRRPDWTSSGLDEFLRFDPPLIALPRLVTQDTSLGDQVFREGDLVWAFFASANRDEEMFSAPAEIDVERSRNPHLAFGAGIHRCLGSNLARSQITIGIDTFFAHVENVRVEPGAKLEYVPGHVRHLAQLPVLFDAHDGRE